MASIELVATRFRVCAKHDRWHPLPTNKYTADTILAPLSVTVAVIFFVGISYSMHTSYICHQCYIISPLNNFFVFQWRFFIFFLEIRLHRRWTWHVELRDVIVNKCSKTFSLYHRKRFIIVANHEKDVIRNSLVLRSPFFYRRNILEGITDRFLVILLRSLLLCIQCHRWILLQTTWTFISTFLGIWW